MKSDATQLKIFYSATSLITFVDRKHTNQIIKGLTSGKGWTDIIQKSGKVLKVNNSQIFAIEISDQLERNDSEGTVPIKTLAALAGVHPITITRQFEETLSKQGKLSKATLKTAKELIEHLKKKKSITLDSEEAILKLFKK